MRIEVWADLVCPYCYLAQHQLRAAIATLPRDQAVSLRWRSFELNRSAASEVGRPVAEYLAATHGVAIAAVNAAQAHLTASAASLGLDLHLDKSSVQNSFDAHRLVHLARSVGRAEEVLEALFAAYFTDGAPIGDPAVLAALGRRCDLEATAVDALLAGDAYGEDVRSDEEAAAGLGVHAVPFVLIDRRLAVNGAVGVEQFARTLHAAAATRDPAAGEPRGPAVSSPVDPPARRA